MDVTVLLRCGWGLAIISCIVEFLPLGRLSEVVRDFSRRGKLKLSPSREKPPRFTVPQSWFIHFYVLGTMVNTALLLVVLLFAYACTFPVSARESPFSIMMAQMGGGGSVDAGDGVTSVSDLNEHQFPAWSTVLLLAMMELQIFRRLYECSHVLSYSSLARMHLAAYLVGLIFYPAASMTLFTQHFQDKQYVSALRTFVLRRLASLRSKKAHTGIHGIEKPFSQDKRKADRYEIPRGSWFEWVSCAHYLAEIVLYAGFVIGCGGTNLNIWLLFAWVVGNLSPTALETHVWYKTKFEDYPESRRALLPYIF
ncbi:hypothetical protein BDL97_01G112200 [Sphagnum fallax]|nr:hypothetical protein BDL97_01G112200 [Sphagnum fallax]